MERQLVDMSADRMVGTTADKKVAELADSKAALMVLQTADLWGSMKVGQKVDQREMTKVVGTDLTTVDKRVDPKAA